MKNIWIVVIALLWASSVLAQTPPPAGPGSVFQWTQPAANAAAAQGYTYRYYLDSAATGVVLTGVTCTGTTLLITCEALVPAMTAGDHSIQLTAGTAALESAKSSPFSFSYVSAPGVPLNLKLK